MKTTGKQKRTMSDSLQALINNIQSLPNDSVREARAALEQFWQDLRTVLQEVQFTAEEGAFVRGALVAVYIVITRRDDERVDATITLYPYNEQRSLVRGVEMTLIREDEHGGKILSRTAQTGWEGGVTFDDLPTGKYQLQLTEEKQDAAQDISRTNRSTESQEIVWTAIQLMATVWAQQQKALLQNLWLESVTHWISEQQKQLAQRQARIRMRGDQSDLTELWPEVIRVKVVDSNRQQQNRTVKWTLAEQPVIRPSGEFQTVLNTEEPGYAGGTLRCTVALVKGVKLTFTGTITPAKTYGYWRATVTASGLPVTNLEQDMILVSSVVQFELELPES